MLLGYFLAIIHPIALSYSNNVGQLMPIYILNGIFWAFIFASWFPWQMELIPPGKGRHIGVTNFINGLSWSFGPLFGGFLAELFGVRVTAIFSAIIVLVGFIIMSRVPEKKSG
jgi:MFS family permease